MHPIDTPALIDSHCHLTQLNLDDTSMDNILNQAREAGVSHFLSVSITQEDVPQLERLATQYHDISFSVGVHPSMEGTDPVNQEALIALAQHPSCVAIGETGLDYYRLDAEEARHNQQYSFRQHIRAARALNKPLIIHTREAREDTLRLMKEEQANQVGGVLHCFTETLDMALEAIELNFYISFSGIITFKNALELQEVAKNVPLERILVETDSPYLAPVPCRGKPNHPALVKYVALKLSELKEVPYEKVAKVTTENFHRCFRQRP